MMASVRPENLRLRIGGRERRALVVVPAGKPSDAPFAVLVLHGSNQSAKAMRNATLPGFDELASRHGAVVVYAEGYRRHWNDARASINFATRRAGVDDTAFLVQLLGALQHDHGIGPGRTLAVGYSNGGQMVTRLGHEAPQHLAGITLIGASQPHPDEFRPQRDEHVPLPVLLIHGTKDPNVPYEGGTASLLGLRPRGRVLSALQTAHYWAQRNAITTTPTTTAVAAPTPGDPTSVERVDHVQEGHHPVRLLTVRGGGHVLPGDRPGPRIMGRTSRHVRTVDEIAAFHLSAVH